MESEVTSTLQICLPYADHDEKQSTRCDVLIYNQIQMHSCIPAEWGGVSLTTKNSDHYSLEIPWLTSLFWKKYHSFFK